MKKNRFFSFLSLIVAIVLITFMKIRDQWNPSFVLITFLLSIVGFKTAFLISKGLARWIALIGNALIFLLIVVFSILILVALKNFS